MVATSIQSATHDGPHLHQQPQGAHTCNAANLSQRAECAQAHMFHVPRLGRKRSSAVMMRQPSQRVHQAACSLPADKTCPPTPTNSSSTKCLNMSDLDPTARNQLNQRNTNIRECTHPLNLLRTPNMHRPAHRAAALSNKTGHAIANAAVCSVQHLKGPVALQLSA